MRTLKIAVADIVGFIVLVAVLTLGLFIGTAIGGIGFVASILSVKLLGGLIMLAWITATITIASQLGMAACAGVALLLNKNEDQNLIGYKALLSYIVICIIYYILCIVRMFINNGFIWWFELPFICFVFSSIMNIGSGKLKNLE